MMDRAVLARTASSTPFMRQVARGCSVSEEFIKHTAPFISFGKLKASYGETGNDQIGNYLYLQNFTPITSANPYQNVPGIVPSNLPNPYLTWETTRKNQFRHGVTVPERAHWA